MKKKVVSVFLALTLCLTLLPAEWAAGTDAHAQSGTDDTVYSVGSDAAIVQVTKTASDGATWTGEYADLLEAFKAAKRAISEAAVELPPTRSA